MTPRIPAASLGAGLRRGAATVLAGLVGGIAAAESEPSLVQRLLDAGVERILIAERAPGRDVHVRDATGLPRSGHYYSNFGVVGSAPDLALYGEDGTRLFVLDVRTGEQTDILADPGGAVRDPQLHYDGRTILFAYRRAGTTNYQLYEVQVDGSGLRAITADAFDHIEPCWLPDGGIAFISSRANRFVNCYATPVATLHRCERDGGKVMPLSANIEHDNTPAVLPDGRVLFTRWEYVDRSQMVFHHLWTTNPDGTGTMVYYGNGTPGGCFIDARPLPSGRGVVGIFSEYHGRREHAGAVAIFDESGGPDAPEGLRLVSRHERATRRSVAGPYYRDPFPITDDLFLVAIENDAIAVMDDRGRTEVLCRGDAASGRWLHEPRPVLPRTPEPVIPTRINPASAHGTFVMSDLYRGRDMAGVPRGTVKKLLVLETLPMPFNFQNQAPVSIDGTFTIERVLGTVPVEPDGSAAFTAPALRPLLFVALDENDASVMRMRSFAHVMPGETSGCVGCHDDRTTVPPLVEPLLAALRREPSRIEPVPHTPDVFHFPRDIQPILTRNCASCHSAEKPAGGVSLDADAGVIFPLAYANLMAAREIAHAGDGDGPQRPRQFGSGASPLIAKLTGGHHGVKATPDEVRLVRTWIEASANCAGTYAAKASFVRLDGASPWLPYGIRRDDHPSFELGADDVLRRRCGACHGKPGKDGRMWGRFVKQGPSSGDARAYARINVTRPELSLVLRAPLAADAGGLGWCRDARQRATPATESSSAPVFLDESDPDYQALLAEMRRLAAATRARPQWHQPGFRPEAPYLRQMERYGILAAGVNPAKVDPFETDRRYWQSFWWQPDAHRGD